jgi:PAS domain-containing protein
MTFALLQAESTQRVWEIAAGMAVGILTVVGIVFFLLRRFHQSTQESHQADVMMTPPRTENPSAFMAASMQGVIRQLRDQEKELERLHKIERERAEHTERLSEEVTRNMPAGLVVVNATGIISSANPAAEQVLGIQTLGFRRYSEVLGEKSELTRLVGECLTKGSIFRREQVQHEAPGGFSA